MKSALLVLLSVSASFCSNLVYDFAPMETGSKWVYSYYYTYYWVSYLIEKDSFIVTIELTSKEKRGNDTIVYLNIREQGRSINTGYEGDTAFDTTSDRNFVDTVVISPTAITKATGYRCKVFPFFESHGIAVDSVSKGLFGIDSLYFLNRSNIPFFNNTYLQGIGLYVYDLRSSTNHSKITSINLLSFNDKIIPSSTIRRSINNIHRLKPSVFSFNVKTSKRINDRMTAPCLLNGIKLRTHGIIPGCVYVQKHSTGGK